jgi:hypothetical protein
MKTISIPEIGDEVHYKDLNGRHWWYRIVSIEGNIVNLEVSYAPGGRAVDQHHTAPLHELIWVGYNKERPLGPANYWNWKI